METSISAKIVPCLKSFNQLAEQVELPDYSREAEVSPALWGDELGRLRIWAANIGAHQAGQSSLDFRLRDASHISNQITKLLEDLEQTLCAIFDELSEHEVEASDEEDDAWPGNETTTELQQLYEEVLNIVDCLYQMSMLIRKPAQHDMLIGSRMGDLAHFEFHDQQHVRDLHPRAEEYIGQRLGRAITRRRKYLFYRERHHKKLEKGIEDVQGIQRATTGSVLSETIATDFKAPNIDFEETSLDSGMSQTSYAPSLIDGGRVTIPPPPRDSVGGKPFECPYCFFVIDIRSTRSWNRHLFKDIKPYVCTFPDCSIPDRLYDSRREWYYHEITEHGREGFVCSLCNKTLESSKQYERHVARHLEELALFALPRTKGDYAENDNDDIFDAKISASHTDVVYDSSSEGSSLEGEDGKAMKVIAYPAPAARLTPTMTSPSPSPPTLDNSEDDEKSYRWEGAQATIERVERTIDRVDRKLADRSTRLEEQSTRLEEFFSNLKAVREQIGLEQADLDSKVTPAAAAKPQDKPIKFKDAIGRRFSFPFDVCKTWSVGYSNIGINAYSIHI